MIERLVIQDQPKQSHLCNNLENFPQYQHVRTFFVAKLDFSFRFVIIFIRSLRLKDGLRGKTHFKKEMIMSFKIKHPMNTVFIKGKQKLKQHSMMKYSLHVEI